MEKKERVFAYGTLISPEIMARASGQDRLTGEPARLKDYRRVLVQDEVYPGIYPCPGKDVDGLLYEGLTPEAIARLDAFEGEYYQRMALYVETAGKMVRASVYVFKKRYHHLLTRKSWDYHEFRKKGKEYFTASYSGFGRE